MKQITLLSTLFLLSFMACQSPKSNSETSKKAEAATTNKADQKEQKAIDAYAKLFGTLPKIAENPANTVTDEKIELGRKLYFDPRLSKSGEISCNSCHNLASYGVDNLPVSLGHKWQVGTRNSPSTLNAALHTVQFWDGREPDVEAQAKGPVLNPIEMGSPHEKFVVDRLLSIPDYVDEFSTVFKKENAVTYDNMAKAIAAFERTLITTSRFDKYLDGDAQALSKEEKIGLETFKRVGCTTCHAGPLLGGNMYQKFGLFKPFTDYGISDDTGKYSVTKEEKDKYLFKVPSLRNITRTYPYFHDGSIWKLEESIQIMAETQLNKKLSEQELSEIKTFLSTLEGELTDNILRLPILPPSGPNTPKPDFN